MTCPKKELQENGAEKVWASWRYMQDVLGDGKVPSQMKSNMGALYPGFPHQAMYDNKKSAYMKGLPSYMKTEVAAKNCGEGNPEVLKKWIKHATVCSPAMWNKYFSKAPNEFAVDKEGDGSGRCGLIVSYSKQGGGLGEDCRKHCANFIVCLNVSTLNKLDPGGKKSYYSTNHLKALKVFFDKKVKKGMAPMIFTAIGFFIVDEPFKDYQASTIIGNSCANASIGESLGALSLDSKVMTPVGTWSNPTDHGRATAEPELQKITHILQKQANVKGIRMVCDVTNGNKLHRLN